MANDTSYRPITPLGGQGRQLLARLRAGAELVTIRFPLPDGRTLVPEVDDEPVHPGIVKALIRRGLVRPKSHTSTTTTWEPTNAEHDTRGGHGDPH